jgi:protein-tyrosine phosphatase
MFNRILVVCVGNICRSPTAEFMLKSALPGKHISSAGLGALVGHDMDAQARTVAEQQGLSCPKHQARQLTRELCHEADLILVMEQRHRDGVTQLCPEARGKVFLIGQDADIADPYRQSDAFFQRTYAQLQAGCSAWAKRLAR